MRVRVSFDKLESLTLDLNEDQIEALQDEFSWEPFYESIENEILAHAESHLLIDDVRVLP